MGLKFKIIGGTNKSSEDLCRTCRNCIEMNEERFCGEMYGASGPKRIKQKIYTCTSYNDKRLPTKMDLYEQAWILQTNKGRAGRDVGFVSPKEFKALVKEGKENYDTEE